MMLISLEGSGFSTSVLECTLPKEGDSYLKFRPCQDFGMSLVFALASLSTAIERGEVHIDIVCRYAGKMK